jgi:hypothetical protein
MSDGRNAAERLAAALDAVTAMLAEATPIPTNQPDGWSGFSMVEGMAAIYGGPSANGYRTGLVLEFKDHVDCEECSRPSQADVQLIVAAANSIPAMIEQDRALIERYDDSVGPDDREEISADLMFAIEAAAARWSAFLPSVLSPVSVGNPEEQP